MFAFEGLTLLKLKDIDGFAWTEPIFHLNSGQFVPYAGTIDYLGEVHPQLRLKHWTLFKI